MDVRCLVKWKAGIANLVRPQHVLVKDVHGDLVDERVSDPRAYAQRVRALCVASDHPDHHALL